MKNFNEIFRKGLTFNNIESHKKACFTLSLENKLLHNPQGGFGDGREMGGRRIDPASHFWIRRPYIIAYLLKLMYNV